SRRLGRPIDLAIYLAVYSAGLFRWRFGRRRRFRRFGLDAAVQPVAQLLAGLEERHHLLLHRHGLAGARVAAAARIAELHREGAEAAQLHALALGQGAGDLLEDGRHDAFDVAVIQVRVELPDPQYQLRFGHLIVPAPRVSDRCGPRWFGAHPAPDPVSLPSKTPGVKGKSLIYMSFLRTSSGVFAGLAGVERPGIGVN